MHRTFVCGNSASGRHHLYPVNPVHPVKWSILVLAIVALVGIAACDRATPTAGPAAVEPTPTTVYYPQPRPGVLRVAAAGAAPHRDLHRLVSEWATLFGPGLAYGRLLRFQTGPDVALPSMAVECDLCERWRIVDPLQYEFDLRPDARWQDAEGFASRPVTAQDVVFSLERLRTPGFPHASLLEAVDVIEPVTDRTVRLRLRTPDADLPQKLASPNAVILAPESLSGLDLRTGRVVGSGPWRYQELLSGQVRLLAWDGYFRPGVPAAQGIDVVPARTTDGGGELLVVGGADVAPVTAEQWRRLEPRGFQSTIVPRQGRGVVFAVNARRAPLDRVDVRRAVFQALDPWAALDEAFGGLGAVGVGVPVVEASWLLPDEQLRQALARPDEARAAVGAAGVARDALTLTVANYGAAYVRHGELLGGQLRAAGLDVAVRTVTRAEYAAAVWRDRDFDLAVGPLPPVDTTNSFLLSLLHSDGSSNVAGLSDAALDALLVQQAGEIDGERRGELIRQIQQRVLDEAVLFMPAVTAERWAYGPRVQDFWPNLAFSAGDFWSAVRIVD